MGIPLTFLIAGGTGRQGGAVVNAILQDRDFPVKAKDIYVITRNLEGSSAQRLIAQGINLVAGTFGSPKPIFDHLGASGIQPDQTAAFMAQAHGPTELEDGRKFINAAVAFGLQYFVYSSVDRGGKELSDNDPSYCKTFSDKFHIEKHLISVASRSAHQNSKTGTAMDYTILRPVWFADNALWGFPGRLCMTGWRENMNGKSMQVIVSKDLGKWAAQALLQPDASSLRDEAISVASDKVSFDEVDEIFRQETGSPVGVTYGWLARFIIWAVKDLHTMFGFINEREYGADLQKLAETVQPTTFREWVRESMQSEDDK